MNTRSRKAAWLSALFVFLTGCSKSVPVISTQDQQDAAYREGCGLIEPYMRLQGKKFQQVDEAAKLKIERGIALLGAVVQHAPDNWPAYWIQGKGYQAMGDAPAACDAFKKSFDLQPANPDVAREYMFECLMLGRGPEGLRAAKQAVDLHPTDPGLQANLALAYLVSGNASAAKSTVDEALRLDPTDPISQRLKNATQLIIDGTHPLPKKLSDLKID